MTEKGTKTGLPRLIPDFGSPVLLYEFVRAVLKLGGYLPCKKGGKGIIKKCSKIKRLHAQTLTPVVEPFAFEELRTGDGILFAGQLFCQRCQRHGYSVVFDITVINDFCFQALIIGVFDFISNRNLTL